MIVGLTGFAQSGKDTAASFLVKRGFTRIAFADILRQSLYNLNPIIKAWPDLRADVTQDVQYARLQTIVDMHGWDQAKVGWPEIRELLQRFGTEVGRELYGENFWVEMAMAQIKTNADQRPRGKPSVIGDWVITDVRFPNEEQAVHNAGGLLFRIERPGTEAVNPHASEAHVLTMPVDGVIRNDGDMARYEREVLKVVGLPLE